MFITPDTECPSTNFHFGLTLPVMTVTYGTVKDDPQPLPSSFDFTTLQENVL
jgi:hypothetical protein